MLSQQGTVRYSVSDLKARKFKIQYRKWRTNSNHLLPSVLTDTGPAAQHAGTSLLQSATLNLHSVAV